MPLSPSNLVERQSNRRPDLSLDSSVGFPRRPSSSAKGSMLWSPPTDDTRDCNPHGLTLSLSSVPWTTSA
jgi:hypothetical protein